MTNATSEPVQARKHHAEEVVLVAGRVVRERAEQHEKQNDSTAVDVSSKAISWHVCQQFRRQRPNTTTLRKQRQMRAHTSVCQQGLAASALYVQWSRHQ